MRCESWVVLIGILLNLISHSVLAADANECDPQGPCTLEPFTALIPPREIEVERSKEGASVEPCKVVRRIRFPQSAEIVEEPWSTWGMRDPSPIARVYEGMTICVMQDGRYTVDGAVETPATSVELRVQFQITKDPDCQGAGPETITLPPMFFDPSMEQIATGRPIQWKIHQEGTTSVFEEFKGITFVVDRLIKAESGIRPGY